MPKRCEFCGERVFLNIDIRMKGMESEILEGARQPGSSQSYVVSTAPPEVAMELKARSAAVPVGMVCKLNDARTMTRLAAWGVDGIISNNPRVLV
jgi:hypothetical protein